MIGSTFSPNLFVYISSYIAQKWFKNTFDIMLLWDTETP